MGIKQLEVEGAELKWDLTLLAVWGGMKCDYTQKNFEQVNDTFT